MNDLITEQILKLADDYANAAASEIGGFDPKRDAQDTQDARDALEQFLLNLFKNKN